MRTLVAAVEGREDESGFKELGRVKLGSYLVVFGTVDVTIPSFDAVSSDDRDKVLLAVRSLSCNFRDKAILIENVRAFRGGGVTFVPFGSEFCAEVLEVGADVSDLTPGDRVMGNGAYPYSGVHGVMPGIPTNFASLGYFKLPRAKLARVPDGMDDVAAAAFSLGAQTATAMVRSSGIVDAGGNPIVFSCRSSTGLFVIQCLLSYGFVPVGVSSSEWTSEERSRIAPATVLSSVKGTQLPDGTGRFTHAFDPFFDVNFSAAVRCLSVGGRYMTCGFRDQHPLFSEGTPETTEPIVREGLALAIPKLLTMKAHCLGTGDDLDEAIVGFQNGVLEPVVDSVFRVDDGIEFVNRSFVDRSRFGKVVLQLA
ncbi:MULTISPECIES: zinc-binding alcohol dehydrogenase family protein [unclassified Actinomyces]|uniref:quinone oxidoreductase family protein n=1 Tax=unclassified Actinomyces TaxID=2609248 RepID=UPI0011BF17B5|nr:MULTISPECIES: zinc-binding alcohol dehydrogenase family protein [unclassified Actinomyces]